MPSATGFSSQSHLNGAFVRVYDNSPDLIDWLAGEMREHHIKPEVEAFDLSMIFQAARMEADGRIQGPLHVQFVMGIKNAMPVDRRFFEFYVETLKRLSPRANASLVPSQGL